MKHRHGRISAVVCTVLIWGLTAIPAQAIWMDMTPEQARKAEKVGGFNASNANPGRFMERWTVNLGEKEGAALLMTEFLSVAFAAQEAARNMAAMQPWEVQDAIARARGKLVFSVTTFNPKPGYADNLRGWVEAGKRKIQNSHWQNGSDTAYSGGGYTADSTFWFPSDGIGPEDSVVLVVQDSKTGREWRFPFDLSKMR